MTLRIQAESGPLRVDEYGVVRVGNSQVLLDVVLREFNRGSSPEKITSAFPTLNLADVYGVIAYYLHHRAEVDEYLRNRYQEAEKLRQEIEGKQPAKPDLRDELLDRKARMEQAHAAPGQ